MAASRKSLKYWTVDAFSSIPFAGNQAAVIVLSPSEPWPEDSFCLKVAAEFNYAETAFIRRRAGGSANDYDLRWFTPVKEVKLCGHATLASAYVLKNHPEALSGPLTGNISFHTLSGELIVDISSEEGFILMDFPADPPSQVQTKASTTEVAEALGCSSNKIANIEISSPKFCGYAVVEIAQDVDLASLPVDSVKLAGLFPENLAQGITSLSKDGILQCRVFASSAGIPEDPVTGSMYTVLGPYWRAKIGRSSFTARQCSTRGGDVEVKVGDNGRVIVGGKATGVMEGTLFY